MRLSDKKHRNCILGLIVLFPVLLSAQPIPTNEWVNFFSTSSSFNDEPIQAGSVVDAYDPDGVWCGSFTVTTTGQYGFLLVYRDDNITDDIDEGSEPGDSLAFYIDGHYALTMGPGNPVWTSNGDVVQVDLSAYSNYAPVINDFPTAITFRADTSVTLNLNETVEDLDDPDLDLHWSVSGNISVIVDIDSETNLAQISAPSDYEGTEILFFEVSDDSLATDSISVPVIVEAYVSTHFEEAIPQHFVLSDNYPNPFNPVTHIRYGLSINTNIEMVIWDIQGKIVLKKQILAQTPGWHSEMWPGDDAFGLPVSSGIYFCTLRTRLHSQTIKMTLMR
jgi:hypothetical protein